MSKKFQVDFQIKKEWGENSQMSMIYKYADETTTVADVLHDFYKKYDANTVTGITIKLIKE
jgi:hypothetical protein